MSYQFANHQVQPINASINAQSSFGLSANVAALVSYLFVPVTSLAFIITEKQNRLVRFHAWQSLFFGLGLSVVTIVLSLIIGILSFVMAYVSPVAGFLVTLVSLLVWIVIAFAIFVTWILCLVKAYRGQLYKLPIVGNIAERML